MDSLNQLIEEIEIHSPEGIRKCFAEGVNPNASFRNEPLIFELTSEYTRSPRFKDCVKAFVDAGLEFQDKVLLSVLLNDATGLQKHFSQNPHLITKKYSLRCAYTPLHDVSLLHICAEFNHVLCAEVLISGGVDVNVKSGSDEYGFGGQTPIFHTVNQNGNSSREMLDLLLSSSADLNITLPGIVWGKSYEWETFIPAVNPISYAMMGLLPQMHRDPATISKVVSQLIKHQYAIDYVPGNVPCAYLQK